MGRKRIFSWLRSLTALGFFVFLLLARTARADNAAFDLIGPKVEVHVQRGHETLPIAQVPNLQAGDRLWIHPDLPDSQSVHYLMTVVFLRGATNPPPDSWFTRAETWTKPVHEEGIFVTVPAEAEEALVLLAPETGGAFSTLRAAVRGKPGAFVRAAQDLEQLSLDRSRLETYLEAMRENSANDPDQLKARTTLLARSLNIRLDQQCFDKPSDQQVPCLTQNTDQLVLDDAHSQNMVAALTSGPSNDLLAQLSASPTARGGYYSPYVGAVVDVVRILGTTHTAQYQYIPALSLPKEDELNLRLNNPPSFRNPKSVLVIGLPPVRPTQPPPLRAAEANQVFCASKPGLVLPAENAPLVFSTNLAHSFVVHVEAKSGPGIDLPAKPDPARGGFVVDTSALKPDAIDSEAAGILRGMWGFRPFEGARFRLRTSRASHWTVASKDASALIVGREDTLHLESPGSYCVSEIQIQNEKGKTASAEWKSAKPDEIELKVPLQNARVGSLRLLIKKFGLREPDEVSLPTFAEAARLDSFIVHAGDSDGVLKGTRLDQVSALEVDGIKFYPDTLSRANQHDELKLIAKNDPFISKLRSRETVEAQVTLQDGRTLELSATIEAPRPRMSLLSKNVQLSENDSPPMIQLGSQDELPQDARLAFFLKSQVPETFSPSERVEVATEDESFRVFLSVKDGNLTMQDAKTIFAVLDPVKLLGPSAFGPLKFRAVSGEGLEGDWQPLADLVRIPDLKGVRCAEVKKPESTSADSSAEQSQDSQPDSDSSESQPSEPQETAHLQRKNPSAEKGMGKECTLSGDKLFLIDAVSADPDFTSSITVPDGFVEATLTVPPPKGKTLYIRLRDDPATVDTAVVPILKSQP